MRQMLRQAVEDSRTSANSESVDDALEFIEDSLHCFHLYQGHRNRVINQQIGIAKVDEEMIDQVLLTKEHGTTMRVTIDFKQNYLEQRLRENQISNYGQRGIVWHIACAEFYQYEAPCEGNDFKESAIKVQVPLDQILDSGNKKDGETVLCDLEALLVKTSVELPCIKYIIINSDNAGCYHKKELLLSIPILNANSDGPKISRVIRTETQDGKGQADSHGACGTNHIDCHFLLTRDEDTQYNKSCTPLDVAKGLSCNGGLQNTGTRISSLTTCKERFTNL
jgi:hypothetical protein